MCKKGIVSRAAMNCLRHHKCNVIEMTVCFHIVNGVIKTKIKHAFGMVTPY